MNKKLLIVIGSIIAGSIAMNAIASQLTYVPASSNYVNFLSSPSKRLKASIIGSDMSFQLSDIKGWDGVNLTSSSFGNDAYAVFRNDTNTSFEIMQIDPTTIGSSSIVVLARGLAFNGDFTTSTARMLTWIKNTTIVELGTDVPQMLGHMVQIGGNQTIAGLKIFTTLPQSTGLTPANTTDLTTKAYVDGVAVAGAPAASTTAAGIAMISTGAQMASSTATGTFNALVYNLVPANKNFSAVSGTNVGVVTNKSGTIATGFIGQSTSDTYNFQGSFTSASTTLATTTITGTATISSSSPTLATQIAPKNYVDIKTTALLFQTSTATSILANDSSTYTFNLSFPSRIMMIASGYMAFTNSANVTADWTVNGINVVHYFLVTAPGANAAMAANFTYISSSTYPAGTSTIKINISNTNGTMTSTINYIDIERFGN